MYVCVRYVMVENCALLLGGSAGAGTCSKHTRLGFQKSQGIVITLSYTHRMVETEIDKSREVVARCAVVGELAQTDEPLSPLVRHGERRRDLGARAELDGKDQLPDRVRDGNGVGTRL